MDTSPEEVMNLSLLIKECMRDKISPIVKQYEMFWSSEILTGTPIIVQEGLWIFSKKGLQYIDRDNLDREDQDEYTINFSELRLLMKIEFITKVHPKLLLKLKTALEELRKQFLTVLNAHKEGTIQDLTSVL